MKVKKSMKKITKLSESPCNQCGCTYKCMRKLLRLNNEKISEIIESFPKAYSTKEIRVEVGDERKFEIIKELANRMKKENREFIDVDGIRADFGDGWWLARASNTQPDITTRCEAFSEDDLENCKNDLKKQLALSGVDLNFD